MGEQAAETRPLGDRPWVAGYLEGWACQMAARFGHPVYLVGSALTVEMPRDVDIVCVLPDAEFASRYCPPDEVFLLGPGRQSAGALRWYADLAKLSRQATELHPSVNIDFKVQPLSLVEKLYQGKPALRVDIVPLEELKRG